MSGPVVWIEIGDRPKHMVAEQPELPTRGSIVRVEKVEGMVDKIAGWSGGGSMSMYRLTDKGGRPLLMGLSNSVDAAALLARSRGWRPETASIITQPKAAPVAKKSSKTDQSSLGFEE